MQSVSQFYTSSNPTIGGSFPVIDIAAIVLVILIVAGLLLYNERRVRASAKVKDTVKPQATEVSSVPSRGATKPIVTDSATMFCRKCGAKIPRDSTFCKECGEKTTKA
jgi:ribosomal protein L40E